MQIHPAVIIAISEHHCRTKAARAQPEAVVGVLLGKKSDHDVEIIDSFELCYDDRTLSATDNHDNSNNLSCYILNKDYIHSRKLPLVNQMPAGLALIGWYSTKSHSHEASGGGGGIDDFEISIHRQISEFIANPIYVKLDPYRRESVPKLSGSLPLKIYEPVVEIDATKEHLSLIEVPWTIVTEDVEIIGSEHNSKGKQQDTIVTPSAAIDYLQLQHSSVKMLKDRIRVISKFVKDVQSGALPYHEDSMADIARLVDRFPLINSEAYTTAHNMQCNDVALNTYLGILSKGSMCKMNFGRPSSKVRALSSTHARR